MPESGTARRHVLVVDHCARMGGAELSLAALAEDLVAAGHTVTAVLAEPGPLADRLRAGGVTVRVHDRLGIDPSDPAPGARRGRPSPAAWWRLAREVRAARPDAIVVNSARALLTVGPVLRATAGAPVLWAVRDIVAAPHFSPPVQRVLRWAARTVPHQVVANSRSSLAAVGLTAAARARVVYPGVEPATVRPDEPASGGPVRVAVLGRLAPWKGQDVVVEAVAAMARTDVLVDVIGTAMFGETAFEAALAERVAALGLGDRVRLVGGVDAPQEVLPGYDVLVHSAREPEAFGRVVAEGMTAGLAVVATRTGGPAEQVTDGVDGLLVPPGDARALATAIDTLVADPARRARLGTAAVDTARRFSRARQRDGWLAAVEDAVTGSARSEPVAPTVSVVVPSYRRAESLARTLKSLATLDPAPLEVLVVARPDDAPTRAVAADHGVPVVDVGAPGVAHALAAGGRAARGTVVAFTDDDAEPPSDWVGRIAAAYAARPGLGAYGGRDDIVGKDEPRVPSDRVGRVTWFGRVTGLHARGSGPAVAAWQLKGVNLSVRRDVLVATDLGRRVHGAGAQHGWELFVCLAARQAGWDVVYDPSLEVVHHAEDRDDGSRRGNRASAQMTDDVANRVAAALRYGVGVRRFSVPLFSVLVGERPWPGLVRGTVLAAGGEREAPRMVAAVLRGAVQGVADTMRERRAADGVDTA